MNGEQKDNQCQNGTAAEPGEKKPMIFLFDVDGTLTLPRQVFLIIFHSLFLQEITPTMFDFLKELRKHVPIAVVGGSDLKKIFEQLGAANREEVLALFDYIFAENGLIGYHGSEPLPFASITKQLGEQKCQELTNFCLRYMSELELPFKRGTFVEHRNGMINVSPCGRSCTQEERMSFVELERVNPIREQFVAALRQRFPVEQHGLTFSIGGQISIDIFPAGWDKTYCLRYLMPRYEKIHFFGDKTMQGGNDYEIFSHPETIGHTVSDPAHCRKEVSETLYAEKQIKID